MPTADMQWIMYGQFLAVTELDDAGVADQLILYLEVVGIRCCAFRIVS